MQGKVRHFYWCENDQLRRDDVGPKTAHLYRVVASLRRRGFFIDRYKDLPFSVYYSMAHMHAPIVHMKIGL